MSRRRRSIPPAPVAAAPRRHIAPAKWLAGLAIAGLVILAAFGGRRAWDWWTLPARIETALPAPPNLSSFPTALRERVDRARAQIGNRATALEGVAELGRLLHANSFHREAEACWRLLTAEEPRVPRWTYYLAHARRAVSDYDGFAVLLARTLELAPDYAPALLQLADVEFKNGKVAEAERLYRRRLALLPTDPYAQLGLARVALQKSEREEARALLEKICREVPNFSSSHNLYAELLAADGDEKTANRHRWLGREAGRFRDAEDPWLTELEAWCYDAGRLRMLATMAHQTGSSDRAVALLQRAVELAPDERQNYENLGDLYLKLNQAEAARDTLRRGLDLTVNTKPSPRAYVNLSQAHRMLKDPQRSLAAAEEGVARLSDAFEVHDARGIALAELGRREEAVAAFQAALALHPNDANTNFNLALTLIALERVDEAYRHLERSLTLEPTFMKSLTLLADLEMAAGRVDSAGQYIRRIYESAPGMPRAQQLMGAWHLKMGAAAEAKNDSVAAERYYRDGLTADPEHAELSASLGVLYLVQGRFADALSPLETYHRLQPQNAQSSLFLGQVYLALGRVPEARRILQQGEKIAERSGNKTTAENCRAILEHL